MGCDVDKSRGKLLQGIDGAEQSRSAIALERRQNLEGETSLVALKKSAIFILRNIYFGCKFTKKMGENRTLYVIFSKKVRIL